MNETTGLIIGFILTLLIYSYILGDNPLYRLAVHMLVGVSAAYAAVVIIRDVLGPVAVQVWLNRGDTESLLWLIPIFFSLLLVMKRLPTPWIGNSAVALLVGVGAAVALTGAITGTLWPQVTATTTSWTGIGTAVLTICTLLAFQFTSHPRSDNTGQPPTWFKYITRVGQAVLMITFGALFANVLSTALTLLTSRLDYYVSEFIRLLL